MWRIRGGVGRVWVEEVASEGRGGGRVGGGGVEEVASEGRGGES